MTSANLATPLAADEIEAARGRIVGAAIRTPLVPAHDGATFLKLECLQPTGSYKMRGATNALAAALEAGATGLEASFEAPQESRR